MIASVNGGNLKPWPPASEVDVSGTASAAVVGIAVAFAALYLSTAVSWRQAVLFLVGTGAGVVLYHASFGFTTAWRVFISARPRLHRCRLSLDWGRGQHGRHPPMLPRLGPAC